MNSKFKFKKLYSQRIVAMGAWKIYHLCHLDLLFLEDLLVMIQNFQATVFNHKHHRAFSRAKLIVHEITLRLGCNVLR